MMGRISMLVMATSKRPALTNCSSFTRRNSSFVSSRFCHSNTIFSTQNPTRRSGNYGPTMWDFEYIQSIKNDYVGEKYMKRFNELKKEMKMMMNNVYKESEELEKLELIDNLQRLGVSYHFNDEIKTTLRSIHQQPCTYKDSLYAAALKFRILRQHGFCVSQDVLNNFKNENNNIKQSLYKDTKGLLQLYEASFLSTENESTLESANKFTMSHLQNYLKNNQLPLHWTMLRVETSRFIHIYEKMPNANPILLELAKLDFNVVQATYQEELRNISRWWKSTCLAEKLPFSRDRPVEAYFWTVGTIFEPQYSYCRRMLTKINCIAVTIDDIYDIYGTSNELQLFTDAVKRWDVKAMDQLPEYMKVCYLALFNTINEMAYKVLKEQGINVIPYLTKAWVDYCEASLQEAMWHMNGYKPSLQEYMDNAWISLGAPMFLIHAFCFITNPITKEALESLCKYPDLIRPCSIIVRLVDDLATSSDEMKRGDVLKSVQCYMNEKDATEEEAREHIKLCVKEAWKVMNKDMLQENWKFSETFNGIIVNLTRTGHSVYQYGDGHGIQNSQIKNDISKSLFEPIYIPIP